MKSPIRSSLAISLLAAGSLGATAPAWADGPPYAYQVPGTDAQPRPMTADDWSKNADGVAEDPDNPMSGTARAFRNGWVQRGNYDVDHPDELAQLAQKRHPDRAVAQNGVPPLPQGAVALRPPLPPQMQMAQQPVTQPDDDVDDQAHVQPVILSTSQARQLPPPPQGYAPAVPYAQVQNAPAAYPQAYAQPQVVYVVPQSPPTAYVTQAPEPQYAPPPRTVQYVYVPAGYAPQPVVQPAPRLASSSPYGSYPPNYGSAQYVQPYAYQPRPTAYRWY